MRPATRSSSRQLIAMDGAVLNSWGIHMQRSLLMLVTLATVPMVSAEAQRSRSQESDSSKSKSGTVLSGLGMGAGLASGMFTILAGPEEVVTGASFNMGAARGVRRSKPATAGQSSGSIWSFDGAELGELDGNGEVDLSRLFAGDGRADAANTASAKGAGKSAAAKGDGWMPLYTPAADAPGIVKQDGPGSLTPAGSAPTVTLPTSDPICSNGTCAAYVDPLGLLKAGENIPSLAPETEVLNDLTGPVGTIVNPEPGTVVLTVLGLAALGVAHRRRGQRSA